MKKNRLSFIYKIFYGINYEVVAIKIVGYKIKIDFIMKYKFDNKYTCFSRSVTWNLRATKKLFKQELLNT